MQTLKSNNKRNLAAVAIISLGSIASGYAILHAGTVLTMNGKTLSTDLRVIGGKTYVPLADMVKVTGGNLVKSDAGFDIVTEATTDGGGTAVKGTKGEIGQMVTTGKWSFEVVEVSRAASAESQYAPEHATYAPGSGGEELVVIHCKLKNAAKVAQKAMLSLVHPKNIALADEEGQSHQLLAIDKRAANPDEGPNMLPGSLTDFNLIFSVPTGLKLKDLVFSLQTAYDDYPDGGTDVRISLKS